ncbi:thiamine phosphate synthase [Clostridium polyendosporum]|uniref:Thiamine phosphate synthase n=1 Tax=Clostridium polyendosporum TaxID=69208 RepID=A0A919S098_9CLOT|nr:thiamine phosphate synthase [Clostridium polyendosporum]GIM28903.1 thiamine phosphate synthase [Clostridium polyendosporum]
MIYLITNRSICGDEKLEKVIESASKAGVERIILREKDLSSKELEELYLSIEAAIPSSTKILINSNIEVANKVGAFGVQLPFKIFMDLKEDFKGQIGVSVHSLAEGVQAHRKGCSYLLASHIFPTTCKEGLAPKGPSFIKELTTLVSTPVIALGGILPSNCNEVMKNGAHGIAVMSTILSAKDIVKVVNDYSRAMKGYTQ